LDRTSPCLSVPGRKIAKLSEMQIVDKQHSTNDVSGPVTTSQGNVEWSGRQDSNSVIGADNQELAKQDSQRDSQNPFSALDTDLQTVISAWGKLPSSLKAAVVAIVSSSHSG
jgi:hypothetical protein